MTCGLRETGEPHGAVDLAPEDTRLAARRAALPHVAGENLTKKRSR